MGDQLELMESRTKQRARFRPGERVSGFVIVITEFVRSFRLMRTWAQWPDGVTKTASDEMEWG